MRPFESLQVAFRGLKGGSPAARQLPQGEIPDIVLEDLVESVEKKLKAGPRTKRLDVELIAAGDPREILVFMQAPWGGTVTPKPERSQA
jgi:hypothetical protein